MPLLTDDLRQAQSAYGALERLATGAEAYAQVLEGAALPALRQRTLDLEAENLVLRTQIEQLAGVKADLPLQRLIDSVALAAAIGDASMPGRAVASIKADVQTYLTPGGDGIGMRLQQPELASAPAALSSTSF